MIPEIEHRRSELAALCRQFHVQRLEVFGSAARGGFDAVTSDLDFLAEFETMPPSAYATAFFEFKEALERLFRRPVDVVVPSAIRNPWFRESVDSSKALLYAA